MNNYMAFLRKELLESVRTYKLLIMVTVFLIFGIMSPLTAKLMPDLLSSFMPEGMSITLPEPAAVDSWAQFFKNVSQMGLIVTVIVFSGILGTELSKGTLINMLTKGLARSTVIFSKFTAMVLIWTISYGFAFAVTWGYTVYLFPGVALANLLFSAACLWLFGIFLLSVLLFASTLVKSNYGSLLMAGGVVVVLMLINIVPDLQPYNPISLAANNLALLNQGAEAGDLYSAVGISVLCVLVLMASAVLVFRKRRL